jgi:hypothetical protein
LDNKTAWILLMAVTIVALALSAAWYQAHDAFQYSQSQRISSDLEPIAALLTDDQKLLTELQSPPFAESGSGILESYLVKLRRDGIAKTSEMKQRLDTLAENNTAISTLITAYLPIAKTQGFINEANKFKTYAAAWRDRWNSSAELYMAGGNYPNASPVFPIGYPGAVQGEIAATQ